jgi:hypothetical protein
MAKYVRVPSDEELIDLCELDAEREAGLGNEQLAKAYRKAAENIRARQMEEVGA